jgi:hypothetical protein
MKNCAGVFGLTFDFDTVSASIIGIGRRSRLKPAKSVVLTPIPKPRVVIVIGVNPGFFKSIRVAYSRTCQRFVMTLSPLQSLTHETVYLQ